MTDPLDAVDATATVTSEGVAAGAAVPAAPEPSVMGRVGEVVVERLARLIHPDPRTPDQFAQSMIAGIVDGKLGPESEEAKLGASVALCVDVLTDGDVANLPPAVHLGFAGLRFRFLKKQTAKRQTEQPEAPKA